MFAAMAMEHSRKRKKDGDISQDDSAAIRAGSEMTDETIYRNRSLLGRKEQEFMQVLGANRVTSREMARQCNPSTTSRPAACRINIMMANGRWQKARGLRATAAPGG